MQHAIKCIRLILCLTLILMLGSCTKDRAMQPLTFMTIGQPIVRLGAEEPGLVIIAAEDELDMFSGTLPADDPQLHRLRQLDYQRIFVVMVQSGQTGDPSFQVQQVTRVDDQVGIRAAVNSQGNVFTAPTNLTELIAVTKTGTWGRPTQFALLFEGKTIAKATHVIP